MSFVCAAVVGFHKYGKYMENNKFLRKQIDDLEKEVKRLKAELAEAKVVISGKTFSYPADYFDIKANLARAIEALEEIATDRGDYSYTLAESALEKIK